MLPLSWCTTSVCLLLVNKLLLGIYGFRFPLTLTCLHALCAAVFSRWYAPLRGSTSSSQLALNVALPIAFLFALSIGLSNVSMSQLPLSSLQMLKSAVPFISWCVTFFFARDRFSLKAFGYVVSIFIGTCISSGFGSVSLVLLLLPLAGLLAETLRVVLISNYSSVNGSRVDSISLMGSVAPFSFVILLIATGVFEGSDLVSFFANWRGSPHLVILLVVVSCGLSIALNFLMISLLGKISPVEFTMLGIVKDACAFVCAVVLFGEKVSLPQVMGYAVALVSIFLYSSSSSSVGFEGWAPRLVFPSRALLALLYCALVAQGGWEHGIKLDSSNGQRVAIVGASGYIGSMLHDSLLARGYDVVGYDRAVTIKPLTTLQRDIIQSSAADIPSSTLKDFDVLIYLGGLTGRVLCDAAPGEKVRAENVEDLKALSQKLDPRQLLIFASTSALAEGSGAHPHTELDFVSPELMDSYTKSLHERETEMRRLITTSTSAPTAVGLRFGTVIGVSRGQRVDMVAMALMKSAFTSGKLQVAGPLTNRAFLWLQDLVDAVDHVIVNRQSLSQRFNIFNLQSFHASIGKVAGSVAAQTGAVLLDAMKEGDAKARAVPRGFALDSGKFLKQFPTFRFLGNLSAVLEDLETHAPDSLTAKGPHKEKPLVIGKESIPCPVCGSHDLQPVLDLHQQPLANDFRLSVGESLNVTKYPLKLVRCRVCNHLHLSHVTDRPNLFSDYLYQSGTSKTLLKYFDWLADKVIKETGKTSGTVLEIACNDGSQLDKFTAKGWKTFGVDPAANIVPIARKKGHTVMLGFWGVDEFKELPGPNELDAIMAQNVYAHVGSPVTFLKNCHKAMGPKTLLYIQTSQCQMLQEGQFDTAYHEHVSFFSGHSFQKAAELSGLVVANFELTPIHGTSCLVTFKKGSAGQESETMRRRLDQEVKDGITTDMFYLKYRERAVQTRRWVNEKLLGLVHSGYKVGAYGAAAKGMVLLHFLLEDKSINSSLISFVVDDAPLKQNRFCPGTDIPVVPTQKLPALTGGGAKVAFIVLAWNFWEEIATNIHTHLSPSKQLSQVLCILPFPTPRLVRLGFSPFKIEQLTGLTYRPSDMPSIGSLQKTVGRPKVFLVAHFQNDESTLPNWIRHHAPMFDGAVLINRGSSDKSLDVISKLAPVTWKVVSGSGTGYEDILWYEALHPTNWKIALALTEFLVCPDLRQRLALTVFRPFIIDIPVLFMTGEGGLYHSLKRPRVGSVHHHHNATSKSLHIGLEGGKYSYTFGVASSSGKTVKQEPCKFAFIMHFGTTSAGTSHKAALLADGQKNGAPRHVLQDLRDLGAASFGLDTFWLHQIYAETLGGTHFS